MFAVIKTGGKQYRVAADDLLKIDKVGASPARSSSSARSWCWAATTSRSGRRLIAGASVAAEVLEQGRGAEGHRLQEAPPQELAAQARPPPGFHPGADHRDPYRWRKTDQGRNRPQDREIAGPGVGGRQSGCAGQHRCTGVMISSNRPIT